MIKKAFEDLGAEVFDSAVFGFPCDLIVFLGKLGCFVEIKDGQKSKSQTRLTKAEADFDKLLRRHGMKLHKVGSIDDVMALVNTRWSPGLSGWWLSVCWGA